MYMFIYICAYAKFKPRFLPLLYKDPIGELRKLLDFPPLAEIRPSDLEERIHCLSGQLTGLFKRKHLKPLDFDPFTMEMKKEINAHLATARETMKKLGFELPAYERPVDSV